MTVQGVTSWTAVVLVFFVLISAKSVILRLSRNTGVLTMKKITGKMKLVAEATFETCWSIGTSIMAAALSA